MRILKLFIFCLFLFTGLAAHALTPAEVRSSYYACMNFLKMSPAKQLVVARRTQYTLTQIRWACNEQKRVGLSGLLKNEREYQRCQRGGCQSPSNGSDDSRTCVSSMQCRGSGENCLNGTCQEVNGANHCGSGGLSCTSGETCMDGVCK